MEMRRSSRLAVIPALVAGIQPTASADASGTVDPGRKARDDSGLQARQIPGAAVTHAGASHRADRRREETCSARPRRLRRSPALRNLVRETELSAHDFVLPLFVSEKLEKRRPIASMPGVFQFSLSEIADESPIGPQISC